MKSFVWIKLSQKVSQALLISAMLSDISFAQNHHWTTASALCTNRSSQLPDLSSVRNGSLLSKLEVGQSTWINAWIGRGPWKWHSLDQKLHPNQGCFTLENPFSTLPHFTLKSPGWNQIECITFCQERQFAFTAMSMQKNELHCYCGNDVPLKRTTQDGYCKEICKNGQHICGFAGYARVVTGEGRVRFIPTHAMFQPLPPTKAATADFRWTSDYGNNTNKWCAALQYVRTIGDYYSPMLARSDCRVDKKAVCVKNSEVSHIVSSHLMSWFEAQKFCHDLIKSTERLSSDMAYALLQANATTPGEEYWTQLSSLYLNSFNSSENFRNLQWASENHVLNEHTCLRAVRNINQIELISVDCVDEYPSICIRSGELVETSAEASAQPPIPTQSLKMTTTSNTETSGMEMMPSTETSTGLVIGAVVGGIMVVIIAAVLVAFLLRRRSVGPEASSPVVASVNNLEYNVYSFDENKNGQELHQYVEDTMVIDNDVYGIA